MRSAVALLLTLCVTGSASTVSSNGAPPVWPAPLAASLGSGTRNLAVNFAFTWEPATIPVPATLLGAFARYAALCRPNRWSPKVADNALISLTVSTQSTSEAPPQLGTDETYTLIIGASGVNATLVAQTVYGALRGLETFSQLVQFDHDTMLYSIANLPLQIQDGPRFPHRGFMVDTSRHFIPLSLIKTLLDSLSYAKLNTLHWHIVDDQSFPVQVFSYPLLQSKGAYSGPERYSQLDVADVVEYARQRGIRVVLEIDTPSHTSCWCRAYPDVCPPLPCRDGVTRTPLDPSRNETFEMIRGIFAELTALFPEQMVHVGQDEVDVGCWSEAQNPTIAAWQLQHGFSTPDEVYVYVANRIESDVRAMGRRVVQWWPGLCLGVSTSNRTCGVPDGFCPCRGVVGDDGTAGLDKNTVLQLWDNRRTDWNDTVKQVVTAGYSVIQSQDWYLEDIHLTAPWQSFYLSEPMEGVDDPTLQARVLGGEVCMWGEFIDGSVLLNTAWPRTAAAAERLWSPRTYNDTSAAVTRLAQFRFLLLQRGIPAGVLDFSTPSPYGLAKAGQAPPGPGSCLNQ